MNRLFLILFLLVSAPRLATCQITDRNMLDTLTSVAFWGRGYTRGGLSASAEFIVSAFRACGLSPMDSTGYRQTFSFPVNTFPGAMQLKLDGKELRPGRDFIISPESRSIHAKGMLFKADSLTYLDTAHKIAVVLKDKLTWSVAPEAASYTGFLVDQKALSSEPAVIEAFVEHKFIPEFSTANLCAMVKGTSRPDSLLLITAHYDHLGGMGAATYFPGANDNASGITLLLKLARYYAANPQRYSMGFICFSGEEAGLIGSKYFTDHPLFPLDKIRFMLNLDMVGTGEEGITVVNASIHPSEFALLTQINEKHHYLTRIKPRGKAANSDHYHFTEKGVPAFFIYTEGGIRAYHDVFDVAQTLPLNELEDLRKLIESFEFGLMNTD